MGCLCGESDLPTDRSANASSVVVLCARGDLNPHTLSGTGT